jgi:general secretion pathway protein A
MYHSYFGLNEAPFSIAVNPRYLFMSARHRDALAHLLYGVGVGGGFILLTGEVGTGKTTINRCLLEQLPTNTDIALILNPALNSVELLATVCDELNLHYDSGEQSLKVLTDKLHQFLLDNHASGRNTVLLIDEAQHLQFEVLEQIRLLTNLETNTKKLLQIILVGQPELRALLNKPELRQLAQRITARYQLKPLNLVETQAYIRHRLQVAGLPANQVLFPPSVVKGIHRVTRGVPRVINVLCDRMLLGTYGQNKTVVDKGLLKQSIVEVMGEEDDIELQQSINKLTPVLWVATALLIAVVIWAWPTTIEPVLSGDKQNIAQQPTQQSKPVIEQPVATKPVSNTQTNNSSATASLSLPVGNRIESIDGWYNTEPAAIAQLLTALAIENGTGNECLPTSTSRLRCERLQAKTWRGLQSFNRPAVLTLISPAKMEGFAVLLGIVDQTAILSVNGSAQIMPLTELGPMWTGDYVLLWQPAGVYKNPFTEGYSGPQVQWLAQQFAELDGQSTQLAEVSFNSALAQRVKIFQRNNQLQADGVVGLKTLLKLNEALGRETTLQDTPFLSQPNASTMANPTLSPNPSSDQEGGL